jgi:hypothetical protein
VTSYARRIRDRVRKERWTGRHYWLDIDVAPRSAYCYCHAAYLGFRRAHVFTPKRQCPCAAMT